MSEFLTYTPESEKRVDLLSNFLDSPAELQAAVSSRMIAKMEGKVSSRVISKRVNLNY